MSLILGGNIMKNFVIFERKVSFPDNSEVYIKYYWKFKELSEELSLAFGNKYKEFSSFNEMIEKLENYVHEELYKNGFTIINGWLIELGIYDFIEKDFDEKILGYFSDDFQIITEKAKAIIEKYSAIKEYREDRKNSRTQIVGGGFGLSGAIKGIAAAGTINTATSLIHSLVNKIGDSHTNNSTSLELDELLHDDNTISDLINDIELDIECLLDEFIDIVNENVDIKIPILESVDNVTKASKIFENIHDGRIEDKYLLDAFFKMFSLDPFNMKNYIQYLVVVDNIHDKYLKSLESYDSYFKVDYEFCLNYYKKCALKEILDMPEITSKDIVSKTKLLNEYAPKYEYNATEEMNRLKNRYTIILLFKAKRLDCSISLAMIYTKT